SVLQAGLALTPGPFVAAAVAGPTSRLVQRLGPRPVLVAGGLIWGAAVLWLVERVGTTPAFLSQWLPGIVLLGIGAGTLFPNLSWAAVAAAPGREPAALAPRARRAIAVDEVAAAPPSTESMAGFLGKIPVFAGLEPSLRESLASRARPVHVGAGDWLFREGEPAESLYVVR